MDDVPAGPASPEPRRFALSVVIPVHNGGSDFERCLRGLRDSSDQRFELIVVDDGSTDDSAETARRFGARVLRHESPLGPAAARNLGAKAASGEVVFFLDADVEVHADTLERARGFFERDPELTALFGSYDDDPAAPAFVSRYRNLLHHFVHQQGAFVDDVRPVHTFWTGCGAIRREAFLALGGFDPERYRRPAIEDIELGYRIHRNGGKTLLARMVRAKHLKRWTLRQVLFTDIFRRGVPWMLLIERTRSSETDLNVSLDQRMSVASTALGAIALTASPIAPATALSVWVASLVVIAWLNRRFHGLLQERGGLRLRAVGFACHYLYFWCCGISVILATAIRRRELSRIARATPPGVRLDGAERPTIPAPEVGRRKRRRAAWMRGIVPESRSSEPIVDEPRSPRPST
ncbi:MAG: glycosyltransferase [Isosphaeraceae bacterium]|nr:glycosyltransferase [Isosphaeraceae bacterium]